MQNKLLATAFVTLALYGVCTSCSTVGAILDYPMSLFDEDTGETVETTVGDAIADNSDGVGSIVANALGGVSPLVALLGGGAAATLLGGARRKKKAALEAAKDPKAKG